MSKIGEAYSFACKAHKNQKYGDHDYIFHLENTYEIARKLGFDREIKIACLLHDILEDTNIKYQELLVTFGEEIAEIIYAVTDELGRTRKETKIKTYPKIKANWKAVVVKLCDRITNVEQSILNNPKKLAMYKAEYKEFKLNLMCDSHDPSVLKVWEKLDELISDI